MADSAPVDDAPEPSGTPDLDREGAAGAESPLLRAGAEAVGRGELWEALRIFERAVDVEEGDLRLCALVDVAVVTDRLGDHAGAVARFREALGEMRVDAPRMYPGALIGLSQALQNLGDLDGAQAALERARAALAGEDAPGDLRFACLVSSTAVALHRQQWWRALDLAGESLDAARRFGPEQAGHPLMNLAAAHFETGRWELAQDFAGQALAAFEAVEDRAGVAETRQNLALMYTRSGCFDDAEPLLAAAQEHFDAAGVAHRAGIGLKVMGFIAEHRGELDVANARYRAALHRFEESRAVIDAADVRLRLAATAFAAGHYDEGEAELAAARATYAVRGLGLHCAQLDYWHAGLLEPLVTQVPGLLARAVDLAVPAALALDAVRFELPDGAQRDTWNRRIVNPALRLAFRYAYLAGDARLVADLIENQCAGTILDIDRLTTEPPAPLDLLEPFDPPSDSASPLRDALELGTALAAVAASAGLPVTPPPRVTVPPDGHIALAAWLDAAEQRYGRRLRTDRVISA
ncbi:tetratricopeptide repeat protein [Nocardia sp. CDC153]|uniref:tetratricopeptide repeat protein n=1 Tax=Nocardia sp. CDC153 TaxID=3112167 RepID=UPI002DBF6982|nr:tetratricopeptide repeat protein [Nocardia sp. CDC153]MEC3952680.1 tetratricopeptide repeat protein [Nocardia sp. CDC153]